jgi:hypothetical protein
MPCAWLRGSGQRGQHGLYSFTFVETLADRITRDGPVNELDAVGWAIRLAKRLESLHGLGVAHGSVSPACILMQGIERTSKAYLADVQVTAHNPAFQSPERAMGGDLSPADDTWAIAATLYTALTGESPFAAPSEAETRKKILAASPPKLSARDVGDDDLQHILDLAFSRDAKQRTTTVVALRKSLEEWHPDPAVKSLLPLDDEESSEVEPFVDEATVMRAPRSVMDPHASYADDERATIAVAKLPAAGRAAPASAMVDPPSPSFSGAWGGLPSAGGGSVAANPLGAPARRSPPLRTPGDDDVLTRQHAASGHRSAPVAPKEQEPGPRDPVRLERALALGEAEAPPVFPPRKAYPLKPADPSDAGFPPRPRLGSVEPSSLPSSSGLRPDVLAHGAPPLASDLDTGKFARALRSSRTLIALAVLLAVILALLITFALIEAR